MLRGIFLLFLHGITAITSSSFSIIVTKIGNQNIHTLQNTITGESIDILSTWGGKINRIQLIGSNNKLRDVIYTRCTNLQNCTAKDLESNATPGAMLIPWANRIYHGTYTFNNKVEHLTKDNSTASQGFLIQGRPMQVIKSISTNTNATLILGYDFDGTDIGYPFNIQVHITYVLSQTGLTVHVDATNLMQSLSAPFMTGCHPYFNLMHSNFSTSKIVLDRTCTEWNRQWQTIGQVPNGSATLFTGFNGTDTIADSHIGCPACGSASNIHWDDGFTSLSSTCPTIEVKVIDGPDTMTLTLGDGYRFVQIYSGNSQECVAVEPMSSETNSWNNLDGIVVLEPSETVRFTFGIKLGKNLQV